jgi:SRSO17 transposase
VTLPVLKKRGPVEAWIIDDTGYPKKGKHSVGVARQYCGQLGKQDNCQIAVSLSVANHHASLPIAYRLYLPKEWANDPERRAKAGVSEEIKFATKPEIALAQIAQALEDGVPPGVALMDAGYGVNTALREGVTALGLSYVAGVLPQTSVWARGRDRAGRQSFCAAAAAISPYRQKTSRCVCRYRLLKQSPGAKARARRCPRVLRACAFAPLIAITI